MRDLSHQSILSAAARRFRPLLAIVVVAAGFAGFAGPVRAANPAEQYIADNVQRGLVILNDKTITKDQRREQFRDFLIGLTDIKTIAEYTLGQYRRGASPADLAAFDDAFKDYALKVYQSYFAKYKGQTLQVTGSYPLEEDETVVRTVMIDPNKQQAKPLEVNFRVTKVNGRTVVIDFSVEGVWIRQAERDDFTSILGQNGGDIAALTATLKQKTQQLK